MFVAIKLESEVKRREGRREGEGGEGRRSG